jgi:hypothetical protein
VARNYVARLNADGTLDTSFNPNANNVVWSVAVQGDGKVLVGGGFGAVGGVARNYVARLLGTTPQVAPQGVRATAGQEQATVSWTAVTGQISSYTATASPGGRTCTTTTSTSCTVTGLTAGTAYTFTVSAANEFGSGPASSPSNAVTPTAPAGGSTPQGGTPAGGAVVKPKNLPGKFTFNKKTRVGTTTGTVPAGVTRITQSARTGAASPTATQGFLEMAKAKRATGTCSITSVRNKRTKKVIRRTYRCTIRLSKGDWTLTTTARGSAGVAAEGARRVVVRATGTTAGGGVAVTG